MTDRPTDWPIDDGHSGSWGIPIRNHDGNDEKTTEKKQV